MGYCSKCYKENVRDAPGGQDAAAAASPDPQSKTAAAPSPGVLVCMCLNDTVDIFSAV